MHSVNAQFDIKFPFGSAPGVQIEVRLFFLEKLVSKTYLWGPNQNKVKSLLFLKVQPPICTENPPFSVKNVANICESVPLTRGSAHALQKIHLHQIAQESSKQ